MLNLIKYIIEAECRYAQTMLLHNAEVSIYILIVLSNKTSDAVLCLNNCVIVRLQ